MTQAKWAEEDSAMSTDSGVHVYPTRELRIGCHGCHSAPRNDMRRPLWAAANRVREQRVRLGALAGAVRLVHGAPGVTAPPDEPVVLSLVRDGEMWIRSFVEHYLSLGVKQIILLDNGSTDSTVRRASRFDRVSVYSTGIPFRHFEVGMRRWLTRTFGMNRWTLAPDIDELWDYPHSDRLSLKGFIAYLDHHGYQAVAAHALDMFSGLPFSRLHSRPDDSLRERYPFYDLEGIQKTREMYWIRNGQTTSEDIFATFGGIRQRLFGSECLLQTRHVLHFTGNGSDPYRYDGHFTAGARVADVSTVLLHYKFVSTLYDQALANIRLRQHHKGSQHYTGFVKVLAEHPDFCMRTPSAQLLGSVNELVDGGLLTVSESYLEWVERHGRTPSGSNGPPHASTGAKGTPWSVESSGTGTTPGA